MKTILKKTVLSIKFVFLVWLPLAVTMEEYCSPEDAASMATPFRMLYKDVCPLTKNKLFESTYGLKSSCAQKCLQDPLCAGYNFNEKKVKPNCQLTNTLDHNFGDCNINDKGWIFYHPLTQRKVPCSKMKHCKNGGKTIIDLRNGPGSNPYRCKCPKGFKGDLCEINTLAFYNSAILLDKQTLRETLSAWVHTSRNWTVCLRATRDGWSASTFHGNCDYKKPTVTIIKVDHYIFGGYATKSWEGNQGCTQAPGSFIFSLRNKESLPPFLSHLKDGRNGYAIHTSPSTGPVFGDGHDIHISNNAASNIDSHTNFDVGYQAPHGVNNTRTLLAGSHNFSPSEIEVFYLL